QLEAVANESGARALQIFELERIVRSLGSSLDEALQRARVIEHALQDKIASLGALRERGEAGARNDTSRDVALLFDAEWYLARYPEVARSGMSPLVHYALRGAAEGHDPHPLFDARWYVENDPTVVQSGLTPLAHYVTEGARE